MSRLLTLIRLDAKLAFEHKLVHVTVVVALVFGALIGFAIPSEPGYGGTDSIHDAIEATVQETGAEPSPPTVLEPGAVKPPFNELMLPVIYTLDLCILGFMFGSVMLLQDKEQGTIRYFRVGPGTSLDYVGSKLTVNLGLSLLNLVILTALGAPWALAKPGLYAIALLICAGMTLLGMLISVFLRNIAQWFFPLIAISLLGTTPVYLMFTPTQALAWTWWVPTYHMLFGTEAVMFGAHGPVVATALVFGLGFVALTAAGCLLAVSGRLMKEAH